MFRCFKFNFHRCDFEGVAKNIATSLVCLHNDVKKLSWSDWRAMLAPYRNDRFDNELVDILHDRWTDDVQKMSELTKHFVANKKIFLHFNQRVYLNAVFLVDPEPPKCGGTVTWQEPQYQPKPWILDEVLFPILNNLERSGFGYYEQPEDQQENNVAVAVLSDESLAFLRKPNPDFF